MLKTMRFTLFRCCIAVLCFAGLNELTSSFAQAQTSVGGGWYSQWYSN